ncbi:hypothetical protein BST95_02535 [Halioglobus japonicus]|uniref:Lipoprotein n=1 Tax=Halioglobus japonicus TaxID=930805 RepID=A0AAP8MCA7_9GAMM|nr:DUF6279 family lipoprotein [Halioglobus japonicus]AQA17266.1 hypothetical protein BST95_02535 [Halioglobus japonicus]PLW85181.1 hypothetical protein C0029_16795 [Halioglobus japonicus]GHD19881.1 hypothetical protein GCM10007052_28890 [Halioglobus japonicus]
MSISRRLWLLACLLLFLQGCSSTTFVYNRLDFFIPWYIGKYVDLDRPQKALLKEELGPFLQWHRRDELPTYLDIIDGITRDLDGEVAPAQISATADAFESAWLRIEARGLEWMLALGEALSDDQMREFITSLREKQVEYEEEYLTRTDAEFHEEVYENLLDSAQDYMGRLDREQRAILQQAANRMQRSDSYWLQERALWLDRLENMLQRDEGWQQAVRDSLTEREDNASPEYLAVYEHNSDVIYTALAALANTRTDKQDQRLRRKLADFRDDIQALIAQGK